MGDSYTDRLRLPERLAHPADPCFLTPSAQYPLFSFEGTHCEQLRARLCPDEMCLWADRCTMVAKPRQQGLALTAR